MKKIKFFIANFSILLLLASQTALHSQWVMQNSGTASQLLSVCFTDQSTGFACGLQGKILKTTNGGTNWNVSTVTDTSGAFASLFFTNSLTGYAAGRIIIFTPIFSAKPLIFKTTNGGEVWNSVLNDSGYTLWDIYFINENTGFAAGGLFGIGPNKFLTTTNSGINWQISSFIEPGYMQSIDFENMSTGFAVNWGGYIYKTTNSGQNWNLTAGLPYVLLSVFLTNSITGFATGGNISDSSGNIFKTLNGGANWNIVYTDNMGLLCDIKFVNQNTGFAAGQREYTIGPISARIVKTTNSGDSWFVDTVFTNIGGLASIYFTDQNTGYTVGSSGSIFKTTTGGNPLGVKPVSGEVPESFSLSQNYPNPFNPSTKIKFDIPPLSFGEGPGVRLIVYDILGREVSILVNEQLKPGTYEVEWDGTNCTSGVYFYKLTTAEYTETRKMVLIK